MLAKQGQGGGLSPALCIKSAFRLPFPGDMTRVLVIDDSDDFRKLALRWFQSCGIEAEGAADGVQGLALQRQSLNAVRGALGFDAAALKPAQRKLPEVVAVVDDENARHVPGKGRRNADFM